MTTWSGRSGPPSTTWLKRDFLLQKQDSNFYVFSFEQITGFLPKKQSDNFWSIESDTRPGTHIAGMVEGFIQVRAY